MRAMAKEGVDAEKPEKAILGQRYNLTDGCQNEIRVRDLEWVLQKVECNPGDPGVLLPARPEDDLPI